MATGPSNSGTGYEGASLTGMMQESFSCGVLLVDAQGRIVSSSPQAERLIEVTAAEEPVGAAPVLPEPIRALLEGARQNGQPVTDHEVVLASPGTLGCALLVTVIPPPAGSGSTQVLLLLKDVSAVRKIEQHMQWLDRLASIGTLSASMAHEIKNALVPVRTFVGLILEQNPDAGLAGTIRREMERVDAMINRMLKFAGPAKPAFAPVRLHELLDHSLHLVRHRVEGRQISFDRRFEAASDSCSGDDHQLEQAFVNLLLNAVEAMGHEGVLTVRTDLAARGPDLQSRGPARSAPVLCVEICDTGAGIAPEKVSAIFEPFFTTKPHGTGLGLAVTRKIIEEHHGIIRVKSHPGKGTTFTVLLPSATAA